MSLFILFPESNERATEQSSQKYYNLYRQPSGFLMFIEFLSVYIHFKHEIQNLDFLITKINEFYLLGGWTRAASKKNEGLINGMIYAKGIVFQMVITNPL